MDVAAPYAIDEHLRVEALRAAVSSCFRGTNIETVLEVAAKFEAWLLREGDD